MSATGTIPFSDLIREARLAKGLSREHVAVAMGCSAQAVSLWEAGRHKPREVALPRLADLLEIPLRDLRGDQ